MYKIEYLPHTADIRVRLEADSLGNLFFAGMISINQIIVKQACTDDSNDFPVEKDISIRSVDVTALLIDFLSEVLTMAQAEKVIFCRWEIIALDEHNLMAKLWGRKTGHMDNDIKAVTYHEAEVLKNEAGLWECPVVFDI